MLIGGLYDKIKITQYDDNSLRIVRYLAGADKDRVQTLDTSAPQVKVLNDGTHHSHCFGDVVGYGCRAKGDIWVRE